MRVDRVRFLCRRDESHDSFVTTSTEPQSAMSDNVISACQTSSAPQGLQGSSIPGIILPWSHHLPACHFKYLGCRFQYSSGYFVTRKSILYCKWLEDNKYAHPTWCLGALFPLGGWGDVGWWGGGFGLGGSLSGSQAWRISFMKSAVWSERFGWVGWWRGPVTPLVSCYTGLCGY